MGGTTCNRSFVVAAHAHGDYRQAVFLGDRLEHIEMKGGVFINGRNTHDALYLKTIFITRLGNECVCILWQDARLLVFGTRIDLNQYAYLTP